MIKKKLLFIASIAFAIVSASEIADAKTITVHITADNGPGSLRQAIAQASSGDKINIDANGAIILTTGELVVDKSLSIKGPGSHGSISGNNTSRVFHIMPGTTVTLDSLTMTNGAVSTDGGDVTAASGGGVFSDHANLTVSNCNLTANSAKIGGAIFSSSIGGGIASLTINNTTISGNSAHFGGGLCSGGGFVSPGDSAGQATMKLNNSVVSNNSAWLGGGIINDGLGGKATAAITNSTVSGNLAKTDAFIAGGGGIYNNGDSGIAVLTLTNSTVGGNIAGAPLPPDPTQEHPPYSGNGGGIYDDGTASLTPGNAQLIISNSLISGNKVYTEPGEAGQGGGIYSDGSLGSATTTLNNSTLASNFAAAGGGGVYSIAFSGDALLTLTDCAVTENVAGSAGEFGSPGTGGGIAGFVFTSNPDTDRRGNSQIMLTNTVISRNVAGDSGGASFGTGGSLVGPQSGTIKIAIAHCDISDNIGDFTGGVSNNNGTMTITDSTIRRNRGETECGGVGNFASGGLGAMTVFNSTISENYGSAGGGAVNGTGSGAGAVFNLDRSTISHNHGAAGAGIVNFCDGVGMSRSIVNITNSTLSENSADADISPNLGGAFPIDPGGGAIYNTIVPQEAGDAGSVSAIYLTNCTISGNFTKFTGGAIHNVVDGGFSPFDVGPGAPVNVVLNNCTVSTNSAGQGGDSIWNEKKTGSRPFPTGMAMLDVANTILNAGASGNSIVNVLGTFVSHGYNLSSDAAGGNNSTGPGGLLNGPGDIRNTNPMLSSLQNNGGPTMTHALLKNSPAINAGDPKFNPYLFNPPLFYDQRGPGFPRIVGGRADIGAYESK